MACIVRLIPTHATSVTPAVNRLTDGAPAPVNTPLSDEQRRHGTQVAHAIMLQCTQAVKTLPVCVQRAPPRLRLVRWCHASNVGCRIAVAVCLLQHVSTYVLPEPIGTSPTTQSTPTIMPNHLMLEQFVRSGCHSACLAWLRHMMTVRVNDVYTNGAGHVHLRDGTIVCIGECTCL